MARSDRRTLTARSGAAPAAFERVLAFEDTDAAPRIIEVGSRGGKPFRARIGWTLSGGVGGQYQITTSFAARVCIVARTLTIDAANLSSSPHEVTALVADGMLPTSNVFEVEHETAPASETVPIPAGARTVRLDASVSGASGWLRLLNGNGNPIARRDIADIPAGGLVVGGASTVVVTCSAPCRVVFELSI